MRRCAALLVALSGIAFAAGPKPRVLVVKSAELSPYAGVVAGFTAEARASVEEITLEEGSEAAARTFKQLAERSPALVLAIGPTAAVGARRQFSEVPIVFAMVPYHQRYELDGPNVTGIALTSDLSPELGAVAGLLPAVKRVGVVADLRFSQKLLEEAAALATARGLTLVPIDADSQAKVEKALKGARGRVDALVLVSDRTVGNAAVVQRLIAWGLEERVPVVGLAAAQVKEGALFSLAPAPLAIGQQAGRLANRLLVEKVDPGALVVAQPDGLELQLNLATVKKLGSAAPQLADVLSHAARKGLAVRVFEGTP